MRRTRTDDRSRARRTPRLARSAPAAIRSTRPQRVIGSQGTPAGILDRALKRRDLPAAWAAAHDLGRPAGLPVALALTLLVLEQAPDRYPRTAARWLARYVAETPDVAIGTAALIAHHLAALEQPESAPGSARALAELLDAQGRRALAETLRRWHAERG